MRPVQDRYRQFWADTHRSFPIVKRASPTHDMGKLMTRSSQVALLVLGFAASFYMIDAWATFLIPVALAVVIGMMLTPILVRIERLGIPAALAGVIVMIGLGLFLYVAALLFGMPLSDWFHRAPEIWEQVKQRVDSMRTSLSFLTSIQDSLQQVTSPGETSPRVQVADGGTMIFSVISLAPPAIGQIIMFAGSLYFYLATRERIRETILMFCVGRSVKMRAARIMRDVEKSISRYLLTITAINIVLGVTTGIIMWLLGMPTPALWGAIAAVFNFVPYVGPWSLGALLLAVGLVSFQSTAQGLAPMLAFAALTLVESQFVTPSAIGRSLTLNPFLVFLAIGFWMYVWGPVGAFLAVPILIVMAVVLTHMLPAGTVPGLMRRQEEGVDVPGSVGGEEGLPSAAE
ncbi:Predicted PurR-regulated permease PerM [Faunimonas pinastri]|uniref:Predicted PurR-regulated permease PerM n=1 Tax=Faunimonas pinastri TaxID=1855383 RepID=A0A1H8ZA61_9HYPH|nr:AI-2E family transporter [Faunimonas pinastri]SEP61369.1 Predicted PurR-regulated permease PerM [Faunimonas pinastri]